MLKHLCLLAGIALLAGNLPAAPPPADGLIQSERQQQLLRTNIETVSTQLHALIEDYQRNGITGDEVQTLQTIAGILARLTGPEIQRVVELLQSARSAPDAGSAQHSVVAAYSAQKTILVQLRQVVAAYRHRQELQELAARLIALADRQHANLNLAIAYVESTQETSTVKPDESRLAALAAQTTEQDAIGAETKTALDRLAQFASQPATAEIAERTGKTLAAVKTGNLQPALAAALTGLQAGQIFNAAGHEKTVRDELRHLAQLLTAPSAPADALRQAVAELDNAIRDQRQVAADAKALQGNDPGKRLVEDRQAGLIDRTDTLRAATANLAPVAAGKLKDALTDMQAARAELQQANPERAATAASQAADKLADAQTALKTEADHAAQTPAADPAAQLRQADQQLKNLIGDQEKLKQDSAAAPDKKTLADQAQQEKKLQLAAQDLQRATAPTSPAVAQSLNDAAQQMQRASDKLAAGQNAGPAQQAALDALQQARQQLQPELADAAQADKTAAALEKLLDRLAQIISAEQKLVLDTGLAAAAPAGSVAPLATAQTNNLTATDALRPDIAKQNADAGTLLADAGQDMTIAQTALAGRQLPAAQPAEQAALDKLYKAKALLTQQLAADAPPPPENPQAAAALDQAQQQIGQALEQLAQAQTSQPSPAAGAPAAPSPSQPAGPPSAAMQQAEQALQNAAQTVGAMAASPQNGLPGPAQAPMQTAQQALAAATAAAAGNNPAAATASATAAQAALAQAQAAAAMVGGPHPGAQPGPPHGPGDGTEPGQTPPGPGGDGSGNLANQAPDGTVKEVVGRSAFIGLPARDRQAIKQSQGEKYPEEFGPMIEQYFRNLADQSSREH